MSPLIVRHLGRWPYRDTYQAMQQFTAERTATTSDEIWLLEHDPVFTQGRAGSPEYLLAAGDIPVEPSDRGGQITHHGPGQITGYLLFDLKRSKIAVKHFVAAQEQAMVATLADYGVAASARADAPGVYVASGAKIGSIGLRIRHGRSYHGLNFNVDMDMSAWLRINPCGLGVAMTQLYSETPQRPTLREVSDRLARHLCEQLNRDADVITERLPTLLSNSAA